MKLTRRELVVAAAGTVIAAKAQAQSVATPVGAPPVAAPTSADFAKQSQDGVAKNRDLLAKFEIPMSTEPAFQFKA